MRKQREKVDVADPLVEGWKWSNWIWIMSRVKPFQSRGRRWTRRNGVGYRLKYSELMLRIPANTCGIFELSARSGAHWVVVYVGSTCRKRKGKLLNRIQEYCKQGSDKGELINDAIAKGCHFYVRVKESKHQTKLAAEREENFLLTQYNYAWNIRQNGKVKPRKILDP